MITQAKATRYYRYNFTLGRTNLSGTGFRNPVDLALGRDGQIYVVNRANEAQTQGTRVTWLNVDEEFLGEFGSRGTGDGQFVWPLSVAVSGDGRVFVADDWLARITVFSQVGKFLTKWGTKGNNKDGEMDSPSGLAFDSEGNLFVVDSNNHRVQKFTPEGEFLAKFGHRGSGDGELNYPWGITVDIQENIYVSDWRNDRVQKFNSQGQFLLKFGSSGTGEGQFNRPTGVAVDKDGDIYVTDWWNNRVQVFDAEGKFITLWTGDATLSKWAELQLTGSPDVIEQRKTIPNLHELEKSFVQPIAIEVDEKNRILVLDCRRDRILVYKKSS